MEKLDFSEEMAKLIKQIKGQKVMSLATCENNYPTVRSMSTIVFNGKIYFQTGTNFLKYKQIISNNNVALSFDNVQIEGIARVVGKPFDEKNIEIMEIFKKYQKFAYKNYSHLADEVLIEVTIKKAALWKYNIKIKPYRIFIEENNTYKEYISV